MSKLFEVVKSTTKPMKEVDIGFRKHKFNKQGMFHLRDSGEASAIQQSVGQDGTRDVTVIEVPNFNERGISVFSLPRGDWKERIDWSK